MKLRKLGQVALAAAVGIGASFGLTSCVQSHTIGYFYVTGHQYNQIGGYKIDNNAGTLTQQGPLINSGGTNPVDAIVAAGGKFLYVLNAGCADPAIYPRAKFPCASGTAPVAGNVSLFTIGGEGVLTFQQSYPSNGLNSVSISTDTAGDYLYVLDQNVPTGSNVPAIYQADGDVSVFATDVNTGRLSTIQNKQVQDNAGSQLRFFPVGQDPVWFKLFSNYLYTIDRNDGALENPAFVNVYSSGTGGQLLTTQNTEIPTGATNLTYINSGGSYLYLLDAGTPGDPNNANHLYNGVIYIYTVGTNGYLSPVVGGAETQFSLGYTTSVNPTVLTVDSKNQFVYVANSGLNQNLTVAASNISSYFVQSNGNLSAVTGVQSGAVNSGTGADPRCILEDPSNQYLFTANYNDSTITGKIINTTAGALTPLNKHPTVTGAPGNPTWCVASGNTF